MLDRFSYECEENKLIVVLLLINQKAFSELQTLLIFSNVLTVFNDIESRDSFIFVVNYAVVNPILSKRIKTFSANLIEKRCFAVFAVLLVQAKL